MFLLKLLIFTILCSSLDGARQRIIPKPEIRHQHGHPINFLKIKTNGTLEIDYVSLNNMFAHPEVQDRKIAVVSIVGAFRKGKSFFLDYCLRFLYANYKSVNYMNNTLFNKEDWMGDPETPLTGFTWKSGSKRDTTGLIFWNDIFLYDDDVTGEKFAIALVDTQGLFDTETTTGDNSKIFALATLISSFQIFSINANIQEDQLQYLQLATDFAKLATRNSGKRPFQHLMFMITNWNHDDDHDIGLEGGQEYIEEVLAVNEKRESELRSVREYIYHSFESISCFLMPTPSDTVLRGVMNDRKAYDGRHSEMGDRFRDSLKAAVESVFLMENIKFKRVNGEEIISLRYKELLEDYLKFFSSNNAPKAESLYEITVNKNMQHLTEDLTEKYSVSMYKKLNISDVQLELKFENISYVWGNVTVGEYFNSTKMGSRQDENRFLEILITKINEKMKIIKNEILNEHDDFLLNQEKATIVAKSLDEKHRAMQQQLAELEVVIRKLERNEFDMDRRDYSKKYRDLNTKRNNLERKIDAYENRKEIEKILDSRPEPQSKFCLGPFCFHY